MKLYCDPISTSSRLPGGPEGPAEGYDFSPYPNIQAWVARMQARPSYVPTYAAFDTMVAFTRRQEAAA